MKQMGNIYRLIVFFPLLLTLPPCVNGFPFQDPPASQAGTTTLRVNVDLVQVAVAVLDSKGKPLTDLKKSDFRIFQDDREQQISFFDIIAEDAQKVPPPSSLNDIDEQGLRGKVVVLLIDQNTIRPEDLSQTLEAAERYVRKHMHPSDLMGVAVYVQSLKITASLTHDPAKIVGAIRQASASGTGSPAVQGTTGAKELRSRVTEVFRGLKGLCTALESVRGHKTIMMFTEDMPVPADVLTEFNSLVAAARKADVSFFTLDARGRSESSTSSASMPDPIVEARPARATGVNLAQFQDQTSATILRSLASQTGGYPVFNTDNLAEALDRVDQELSNYYVLGFESGAARSDGKPHKIEVRLIQKDARLKYRDSYVDPHPVDPLAGSKSESSLRAALSSAAPATQLPVSFRAVYFYDSPQLAQIPVLVKIGRGSVALKKKEGQWTGSATVMAVASAEDGTTASRFSGEVNVLINNSQAEAFRKQDLVYKNFLRLRPGKYRLKLVVMDERGKTGTAERHLVIPAFRQEAMTSSSLIISQEMVPLPGLIKELAPRMLSQMDPMQFRGFQIYAPIEAEIDRERPAAVFYRIYTALPTQSLRSLRAKVQATDGNGESHLFPLIDLTSSALPDSPTEAAIGFMLPVRDLKPGKYRLTVETIEEQSGQSVISETDFLLH